MDTVSLWKKISNKTKSYPRLSENIEVDVAIIGGGITGVTAAERLLALGKKVAIIEAESIGGVTTGYSTGNLYVAVQPYYQNIISKFNLETAKAVAESRRFAIDYIEKNCQEKKLGCHFSRRPWYLYTNDEKQLSQLEDEVNAFTKMGFPIAYTDTMPLPFKFKKAAILPNQARFNPLQYVISLADNLAELGCTIYENTRVIDIDEKDHVILTTSDGHKIKSADVIIATHTPIGINATQLFTAPYRSYVVAVELQDNNYPEGHFWDLDTPHHATCTHAVKGDKPNILCVAGNHHKVGQEPDAEAHFQGLEKFLREHFSVASIDYKWSAQHYHSADNIPYIGLASRFAKHTYMATGYFADGLVYGVIAGILLGDLIAKKDNSWADIYNANRWKLLASTPFLLKEDSNMMLQYYKDFPRKETHHFDHLKPGDGEIVEMDREKWGVYKDEQGHLHTVSAVCTHMKCIVNFNNAEKTWDCPCHGSRFTTAGDVIEGPATKPLKKRNK